ncbi:TetR/AcrR family transcriptional regulator [Amycolatopsis sp. NPDC049252]|uniref:TetR/AcrR family transcriptional regulator n=1 Tax=Amycolatopsis sp. NPDC049252 TaxID=3363933 RepID=UPI00371D12CE
MASSAAEIRERGTTITTLDRVGRRSGTGKSRMFHHFPEDREQLLLAVAEHEAARVFDDQEPYLSHLTSRAAPPVAPGILNVFLPEGKAILTSDHSVPKGK